MMAKAITKKKSTAVSVANAFDGATQASKM